MEISDVKVHILKPRRFVTHRNQKITSSQGLVRIFTDEGIEGDAMVDSVTAFAFARLFVDDKEELIGLDPFDREKIEKRFSSWPYNWRLIHNSVLSALDICLWDIAGKALNLPIYKIIGGCRDKILAYASTQHYAREEDFIDIVRKCVDGGYKAIKIHPYQDWEKDIELCRVVRNEVGDEITLMLDPVGVYNRYRALKVGREIENLDFYWYEDPMPTTDIEGLTELCASLDIEVLIGEYIWNLSDYGVYIEKHATDALRCVAEKVGGITGMLKIAHLAEAYGMKCEPHSWGNVTQQAAHLHVMLAIENCDFFELPVPEGAFDLGFLDNIRIDDEGYVLAPKKPGLGYEIDWETIEKEAVKVLD